jgi:hypothetical protein
VRALFLLLLLANLLFAAWGYWVAPARAPVEGRATPSAAGGDAIRLLREAAPDDAAAARNGETALDAADAALDCVSAGPYLERPSAEQAEQRLARLGFAVQLRQSRDTVRIGEWVRVEDLATPEDAANALAQIKAAGIADAYLLTDEPPGTVISLGVFTDKGRAEQAVRIAKMAGYDPRTVERTREADVFWLDIDRPASAGLPSPDQLGADGSAEAPAVGLRRCPQPAAGAAADATGSLPDL